MVVAPCLAVLTIHSVILFMFISVPEITSAGPCSQGSGCVGLLTSISRTCPICTAEYCSANGESWKCPLQWGIDWTKLQENLLFIECRLLLLLPEGIPVDALLQKKSWGTKKRLSHHKELDADAMRGYQSDGCFNLHWLWWQSNYSDGTTLRAVKD